MPAGQLRSTVDLPDEAATVRLADDVAACLATGDVVALSGGLGAGKTTFARALIQTFTDDHALEVPSPTFMLIQTYAGGRFPISHFDLYRLSKPEELDEIGFDDAIAEGAVLVEWPEKARSRLPVDRLDISFDILADGRRATLTGAAAWAGRIERSRAARVFLDQSGWAGAARRYLQGDASTRRYERVARGQRRAVLMDWASRLEDPARDPRAAHRARDVRAFVAMDDALRAAGFSAPEIFAADLPAGFLLLEDLGSEGVLHDGAPIPERYRVAIEVLAAIHARPRPAKLPLPDGAEHVLPFYRADAFAAELVLFIDWYMPHVTGKEVSPTDRAEFDAAWAPLFDRLEGSEQSWVLLDVHSPNLLWLPDREGVRRIGLLDFQDTLDGPAAYDVASLVEDARATVPPALEEELTGYYVELRRRSGPGFDSDGFREAYAILTAQRATKILGVFARLADHAGKSQYLQHIPRLREYLARALRHPVLSRVALWYESRLPPI
jgi:tRNA threonylcarbamoyl adenosine modification protein YjeE